MSRPYYSIHPGAGGRWYVCHPLAGTRDSLAIDADCPSLKAAETEAAWLEAARQRDLQRLQAEQQLLNRRAFA